ncbi:hypothetical protein JYK14_05685 [Siccirubricoccus sp. KC 17139]|uniref:Organic solvent tolerance-like N-terminal domain-containing protein n=1 Tax=Siccirubricoccus soli TaxID=2899147 RepID=A0ABT1D1B0_9PROT|nr:hypothetical protein [Siccirubricoccus soli]MCO6415669.1 hypothetical protein [Siccirubricoccus soli]MCP2681801.1 hypothetical protein [Siccirubricoccus soli]
MTPNTARQPSTSGISPSLVLRRASLPCGVALRNPGRRRNEAAEGETSMRLPVLAATLSLAAAAASAQWQPTEQADAGGRPVRFLATNAAAFVTERGSTSEARAQLRVLAEMVVLANGDAHICFERKRPVAVRLQVDGGPLLQTQAVEVLPGGRLLRLDRRAEAAVLTARDAILVETEDGCGTRAEMRFPATGLPPVLPLVRPR